ncbi:MAG: phosphopantetheine-binding protein, partial [Myxococcales bacterium]
GGTSVLSAQLAGDLGRQGIAGSIIDLLQYPTVAAVAAHLGRSELAPSAVAAPPGPARAKRATPFDRLKQFRHR